MTKTIVAKAITLGALVLGTGVAHADPFDMDKYMAELKQHGFVEGEDYQDENQVIVEGLIACNGVSEKRSRDAWVNSFSGSRVMSTHDVAITTYAAIDAFCPQFKQQQRP
jgi:uncharacterized protein DUF732